MRITILPLKATPITADSATMPITRPTVIVLASGRGERFTASGGQVHKLQALLSGKKIIDWTLDAVRASGLPFHVEDAGHPGMGDSIAVAVRTTSNAQGWLILPADLPLIQSATLLAVAQALQQSSLVYPMCAGQRGHPVGFGRAYAAQLSHLQGNKGAAQLIRAQAATEIIVSDMGCVTDIDTLQDLERARKLLAGV
jgi:molybdenum cofactor cytidylyltransferase